MSVHAQRWAWEQDLPLTTKAILVVIADCMNQSDEFCFPSQKFIANRIGRSVRQVHTHLKVLTEGGFIQVIPGPGRGRGRSPDRYKIGCDPRTGEPKSLGAHSRKSAAGCEGKTEQKQTLTAGSFNSSQPEVDGNPPTPPYIDNRNLEPELLAKPKAPKKARAKSDTGTCLPDDWALDKALIDYCQSKGYSASEAQIINEMFENYWRAQPGAKGKKLDWRATFRNWVMNQDRRKILDLAKIQRQSGRTQPTAISEDVLWKRRYYEFERSGGYNWEPSWGPRPGEAGHSGPRAHEFLKQGAAA